jgi:hypothetical protein
MNESSGKSLERRTATCSVDHSVYRLVTQDFEFEDDSCCLPTTVEPVVLPLETELHQYCDTPS